MREHDALPIRGALAQLGEHLLCKQGVIGSIPIGSTIAVCGGFHLKMKTHLSGELWLAGTRDLPASLTL